MAVGLVVCLAVGTVVFIGKDPLKRTALWNHAKHGLSQTYWKENTLLLVAVAAAAAAAAFRVSTATATATATARARATTGEPNRPDQMASGTPNSSRASRRANSHSHSHRHEPRAPATATSHEPRG